MLALALLVVLGLLGRGLFDHELWTPDEPREGELGRAMAASSDYLVPRLGGEAFLEKPPLYYAVLARLIRFADSTAAGLLRLPSAVSVLLTAGLTFLIGRRFLNASTALAGALVFLTIESSFELAHRVTPDPPLMLACTLALFGALRALDGERSFTALPFWLGVIAAAAVKGLVGPVLIGSATLACALISRRVSALWQLRPLLGSGIFLAASAAFCWTLYRRDPSYLRELLLQNQAMRFLGGPGYGGGHEQPIWGYLLTLPIAWLPWTAAIDVALVRAPRTVRARVLVAWPLAMLAILSLAATKRAIYAAPTLPALALLAAHVFEAPELLSAKARAVLERFHLVLLLLAITAIPVVIVVGLNAPPWLVAIGLGLSLALLALWRARPLPPVILLCVLAAVAYHEAIAMGFARLDEVKNLRPPAEQIASMVPDRKRFFGFRLDETVRAAMPFYAGVSPCHTEDAEQLNAWLADGAPCSILTLERRLEAAWPSLRYPYEILLRVDMNAGRTVLLIANRQVK
jgi:4-amino-4-deoxy-L-arabinose transferase-like glycosyltransferase